MQTQQILLEAGFPSARGMANTKIFKQKSFILQVKAEKYIYIYISVAGKKKKRCCIKACSFV